MASDFRSGALGVVGSSEPCGMMLVYLGDLICPPKLGFPSPDNGGNEGGRATELRRGSVKLVPRLLVN